MVAEIFIGQGYPVSKVLQAIGLSSSSYYYRPSAGTKGKKPSQHTLTRSGLYIQNEVVINNIKELLQMEFVDYGYLKVTYWLRQKKEYVINPIPAGRESVNEIGKLTKSQKEAQSG
jgi:hypothetical protein